MSHPLSVHVQDGLPGWPCDVSYPLSVHEKDGLPGRPEVMVTHVSTANCQ